MKVPQFLLKAKERTERFLKGFEWTWTKAVVFCLAFGFFTLITMAVIPSFWLYFAEQKLGWDGLSGHLARNGFDVETVLAAGLVIRAEYGAAGYNSNWPGGAFVFCQHDQY